jgi:hypothetical protein
VGAGRPVYLCEGEKDADAMRQAYAVCATTNPFGAMTWARDSARYGYADHLRGADVVIIQDRDTAGVRRTHQIMASLVDVVASLRIVQAAVGNDAADHIAKGLSVDQLLAVIPSAPDADDGSFAALPQAFFEVIGACGLSHLESRILVEVARCSVRREHQRAVWQALPCASSSLARRCGNASPSQVRQALGRLREAGVLIAEHLDCARPHEAPLLRIEGDFAKWRPVSRGPRSAAAQVSPGRTPPASWEDTNTRTDLGLRKRETGR